MYYIRLVVEVTLELVSKYRRLITNNSYRNAVILYNFVAKDTR